MQKTEANEQQAVLDIQPVSDPDTDLPDVPAQQELAAEPEPTPVAEQVSLSQTAIELAVSSTV